MLSRNYGNCRFSISKNFGSKYTFDELISMSDFAFTTKNIRGDLSRVKLHLAEPLKCGRIKINVIEISHSNDGLTTSAEGFREDIATLDDSTAQPWEFIKTWLIKTNAAEFIHYDTPASKGFIQHSAC